GARITDNIHKILENECYMGIVADPHSGSYLVENMTNEFVTAVRKILKDLSNNNIEEYIDKNSKAALEKRKSDLDMQREKLIGVNIYQNHKNKLGSIDKSENRFAI